MDTPYGATSDRIVIGDVGRQTGGVHAPPRPQPQPAPARHPLPGQPVGDEELGVRRVIGPCASGSLTKDLPPGTFVVCDQFIDRTSGRADTFYDGPVTTHVSSADPYCPDLRNVLLETGREQGSGHPRRRHRGGHPGPAVLDPGGVEVVLGDGLGRDQHDRLPGGLAGPRARALLRQRLADHGLRRRRSRTTRTSTRSATRPSSGCSPRTTTRLRELLFAAMPKIGAAAAGHLCDRASWARGSRKPRATGRHKSRAVRPVSRTVATIPRLSIRRSKELTT